MLTADPDGAEYRRWLADIETLADQDIRSAAATGRLVLDRSARSSAALGEGDAPIARSLRELRAWSERLSRASAQPRRRWSLLPGRDAEDDYWDDWTEAQERMDEIVGELNDAAARLRVEDAAIDQEQLALRTVLAILEQYAYMAEAIDRRLEAGIEAITNPERAAALRGGALYAARRRRQDILAQLAVSRQGYSALEIMKENNGELIHAINSATTMTLGAMQMAAGVHQALARQQRVKAQLDATAQESARSAREVQRAWNEVLARVVEADQARERAATGAPAVG